MSGGAREPEVLFRRSFGTVMRRYSSRTGKPLPRLYARWRDEHGARHDTAVSPSPRRTERWLAKKAEEVEQARLEGRRALDRMRVEDFCAVHLALCAREQRPSTYRSTKTALEGLWLPALRGRWLDEVTRVDVQRVLAAQAAKGRAAGTRNRNRDTISVLFGRAVELGHARHNPAAGIARQREPERELPFYELEDQARLVAAMAGPVRAAVLQALRTGMRQSEILATEWARVDFRRLVIRVPDPKNRRPREVPLTADLADALRALRAERRAAPLVPDEESDRVHAHLPPKWNGHLRRLFAEGRARAGFPDTFRFHDLRHVACSTMVAQGLDLATLMQVSGHRSYVAVKR